MKYIVFLIVSLLALLFLGMPVCIALLIIVIGGVIITGFTKNDDYLNWVSNCGFVASTLALIFSKSNSFNQTNILIEGVVVFFVTADILDMINHNGKQHFILSKFINNKINNIFTPFVNTLFTNKFIKGLFIIICLFVAGALILPSLGNQLHMFPNSIIVKSISKLGI